MGARAGGARSIWQAGCGRKAYRLENINSKSILLAICEEYYVYLLLATEYIEC
ncbi:hypothetical protein [Parageobacillus thermoglucosidasius]|uniref:hypothetical protein n=1 Tax=Parageobacillus thermoglucosidasius TaxID=1426 RepID=UPI0001B0AD45|nr:hypothetical protein [Parageobacillus thermoglucosidasius]KYD16995.1 hypothetical protein B4168_1395 [Anoxybacillus flavithermus]OAO84052.1 hypothetical protein GT23_3587 [Parageobacillus thermoglucosidasius]